MAYLTIITERLSSFLDGDLWDRVTKINPNKTILCGNVTIRTSQTNGEKLIIDFTKNRVKYHNRQDKCIYDLEIDNRFKPLWNQFLFELKRVLHLN